MLLSSIHYNCFFPELCGVPVAPVLLAGLRPAAQEGVCWRGCTAALIGMKLRKDQTRQAQVCSVGEAFMAARLPQKDGDLTRLCEKPTLVSAANWLALRARPAIAASGAYVV